MTKSKHILVLDDERSVCESISIILHGYQVHYELSIDGCLVYLRSNPLPDLLVIDYKIGRDNGILFYRDVLIPEFGKIPAMLISGYVGQKEQPYGEHHYPSIFVELVQKPFDIFGFRALINKTFNSLN